MVIIVVLLQVCLKDWKGGEFREVENESETVEEYKSKLSRMSPGSQRQKWDEDLGKATTSDKQFGNLWKLVFVLAIFGGIESDICMQCLFWLLAQPPILFTSANTIIQVLNQKRKLVQSHFSSFVNIPKPLFHVEHHGNTLDSCIYLCHRYICFVTMPYFVIAYFNLFIFLISIKLETFLTNKFRKGK